MAVTPGSTSGTYGFSLTNAGIMVESFDRIQVRPPQVDRHMADSFRASLNLELEAWSNEGFNFWALESGTINLVVNQAVYTFPPQLVTVTDIWYSNVNGNGAGVNQDRIMIPIPRDGYASLTNKLQQGIPTQYWFQMLTLPQVTIWQVPAVGAPNYVLGWYGLSRVQDANLGGGEIPDVPNRALDTLCAGMAVRMAEKFAPAQYDAKLKIFARSWEGLTRRDQEPGTIQFSPNVQVYGRMR